MILVQENLHNILEKNDEVSKSIQNTQQLIDDYQQGITDRLKAKLNELKRDGDAKIGLASEKCNVSFKTKIRNQLIIK